LARNRPDDDGPNDDDVQGRLTQLISMMAERQLQGDPRADAVLSKLTEAVDRMADSQLKSADMQIRAQRPSNSVVPMRSVYNPRGETLPDYRKPELKCVMMIPWLAENDMLTREEVELLNLLDDGEFTVRRIDNTKIRVTVHIEWDLDHRKPTRLLLNHETAFSNDYFRLMPPLAEMLRQILKQSDDPEVRKAAAEVLTMEEEEAMIEAGQLTVSV
jgi:hypothetical protein